MLATVIIPTYNERGNIGRIVREVLAQGPEFRVLVVDDDSPDGTAEEAQEVRSAEPDRVQVCRRRRKWGLGSAYLYGFAKALEEGADRIFEMDADFSHPPSALRPLLEASLRADFSVGSRYVPGGAVENWPWSRRALSIAGNLYARAVLLCGVKDLTAGFKCYRREVLENIDLWSLRSTGYAFQVETTWRALRAGFRIEEVPIRFLEREVGSSKMSKGIIGEAAKVVWKLRLSRHVPRGRRRP